jgi:O-6-methylguanine DNA methyltransferase
MKKSSMFVQQVQAVVRLIPAGEVRTYQQVASAVGKPRAARAVANIMANNFDPAIPCHRVIRSDGHVGGYNRGGPAVKYQLLSQEGYAPEKPV